MRKVTDAPLTVCENCGGKLEKQWSLSGFQFKGEGWYVTDYSNKKSEGGENSDKTDKTDKMEKTDKLEKADKSDKTEKAEKSSSAESTAKTESASNTKSDGAISSVKETTSKKD